MNVVKLAVALAGLFVIQSCDNEIEINAPWKETPVVYGMLDVNAPDQYIRITKTFQNASNLTPQQASQITDSLYFDTLQVTLLNLTTGDVIIFASFNDTSTLPKDPGYFTNEKNVLYKAHSFFRNQSGNDSGSNRINETSVYKLDIFSPKTGKHYTATTSMVGSSVLMPNASSYALYIRPYASYNFVQFKWQAAQNAVIYDAVIRYVYNEYPTGQPLNKVEGYVDQYVTRNEQKTLSFPIHSSVMNNFLKNIFENKFMPGYTREIKQVYYLVLAGSPDLKSAVDLSKPSTSQLQIRPEFNNIDGGLGIFTSRSTTQKAIPFQDDSSKYYLTKGVPNFPQ